MFRRKSKSVSLDEHRFQTRLLSDWAEEAEAEVDALKTENAKLRADLAAAEALLAESEAWRVATVEKLRAVEAERDQLLDQMGEAVAALAI